MVFRLGIHQQVYYLHLQGIQVLHLIHLTPRIPFVRIIPRTPIGQRLVSQCVICKEQQVFEIHQPVVLLIAVVIVCHLHLPEHRHHRLLPFGKKSLTLHYVAIAPCITIHLSHRRGSEEFALHLADMLHGGYVVLGEAIRMQSQFLGVVMLYLMHHRRQMNGIKAFFPSSEG